MFFFFFLFTTKNIILYLGQRDHFTGHSGKRSAICHVEELGGKQLSDSEKLAFSGHRSMKMYNRYANNGEYVARRAADTVSQLHRARVENVKTESS